MNKKTFYITTPIYYPSDNLHIGHAYCTTIADAIARYKRLAGYDVFFVTGSDEHGQKIERKANEKSMTPIRYVDTIVAGFQHLWKKLNISHNDFIRTTEVRHHEVVQEIFQKIYDQGDIYKANYSGWYCTPCETFWLENKLENGNCPDCGRSVELLQEESYFFRLSKYQDKLLDHLEKNPDFIQPASRRNEMINFIKGGLEDLCVSRTTFDWGIQVPFDKKHVVYVWFDALTNYITAAGYLHDKQKFTQYWPADIHLVGKEIVRFHSIIWPIILMAMGIELPQKIYGHGWLIMEGDKMSKSKGNVIDPLALIDEFGADAIRYFLLREIMLGQDGNFSRTALINRINADLANDLGNLLHRTLGMLDRFYGGTVPSSGDKNQPDDELISCVNNTIASFEHHMNQLEINSALKEIWSLISRSNKYIDETAPWTLAKNDAARSFLDSVMYNLTEVLRIVAVMIYPFMPITGPKIWSQLGVQGNIEDIRLDQLKWGGLVSGITVMKKPEPIFPRIDVEKQADESVVNEKTAFPTNDSSSVTVPESTEISIDDFAKMDLRVAKVIACEKIKGADKLLQLNVDLGYETRTIVSGIAKHYTPEDLIGKNVVIIANLKPAKLRGVESKGMVLAASGVDSVVLVDAPNVAPGTKVK